MIQLEATARTKYKEWSLLSTAFNEFRKKYKKLQISVGYELINGGCFYLTAKCEGYLSPGDTLIKTLIEDFEEIQYYAYDEPLHVRTDLESNEQIDEAIARQQQRIDFLKECKTNIVNGV